MFLFMNTVYFHSWFLCRSDLHFSATEKICKNFKEYNNFQGIKTTLSSTLLIKIKFQWYRCTSDIPLFERRFIKGYDASTFKELNKTGESRIEPF